MALITEFQLRAMVKKGIPNPYPVYEGDKLTPAAADFLKERRIKLKAFNSNQDLERQHQMTGDLSIPVGVSNRHVHLSLEDLEKLFGADYRMMPLRQLSQPGQYAAKEQVTLLGPKGLIKNVRILGPSRGATQVEISKTDGFQLGIHPPVKLSGSIENTPGLTLIGPKGCIVLEKGVIIAKCHVHMSPNEAKKFDVNDGDSLMLQTLGERSIIFSEVIVRISQDYRLDFHIDLDEANASSLKTGDNVTMIGKNGKLLSRNGR
ncbi:phosphate propanoyltransferase [Scopulibacillus cellulosilyticus]|uniref:Phosphate propanoyltransferase n=1 Tax=Scopulibacillus cellulosilyticus TaxID=2665665 RepID=A0ABW2PTJ6_9BACL